MNEHLIQLSYFAAAVLFILSLRWLNHPRTARRGVGGGRRSAWRPAIVGTLLAPEIVDYKWIAVALVVGFAVGVPLSWVPLTAVPAADGAVARLRRPRRGPGRHCEVHHVAAARAS